MGNDVDLWEKAKIFGKFLKYLTDGSNILEMAKRLVKWLRYMGHGLSI